MGTVHFTHTDFFCPLFRGEGNQSKYTQHSYNDGQYSEE